MSLLFLLLACGAELRVELDPDAAVGLPPSTRPADSGSIQVSYVDEEMSGGSVAWAGETETGGWGEYPLKWGSRVD